MKKEQSRILSIGGILSDKGVMSDNGRRLWFTANELTDEQALLVSMWGKNTWGFFYFSPHQIDKKDLVIPEFKFEPEFPEEKSPSKRLYDRMFRFYEAKMKGDTKDFRKWYEAQIERIGDSYLEKLNELQL